MLHVEPKSYDLLIDLLADLIVEDLAAEANADTAKRGAQQMESTE